MRRRNPLCGTFLPIAMLGSKEALVTGASGFIGYHLTRRLHEAGRRVRVFVRPASPLSSLRDLPVQIVHGDIEDAAALRAAMAGAQSVFHVAGKVGFSRKDRKEMERVNVGGTRAVLEAARQVGVRTLVLTSSVAAIGGSPRGGVADEELPWDHRLDRQPYAASKRRGEELALAASADTLRVVAVNPGVVVGWPDPRLSSGGRRIVTFLKGRIPFVIDWGFNCVDVRDVVAGHLLAEEKGVGGRRYILGGENLTLKQFCALLAEVSGRRAPIHVLPRSVVWAGALVHEAICGLRGRSPAFTREMLRFTRRYGFYTSLRAERELGYRPRPIREALAGAVRWFMDNGYA